MPENHAPIRALDLRVAKADELYQFFQESRQVIVDQMTDRDNHPDRMDPVSALQRQLKDMNQRMLKAESLYSAVYPLIDHVPGAPAPDQE